MITWLRSLWASASDYAGPGKVEVFGHDEHVGWVRSTSDRIDILTIEGSAIQIDSRARFRLTPITWQELADQCLRSAAQRERTIQRLEHDLSNVRKCSEEYASRIGTLREGIGLACTQLAELAPNAPIDTVLAVKQRLEGAIEDDNEHDDIGFPF